MSRLKDVLIFLLVGCISLSTLSFWFIGIQHAFSRHHWSAGWASIFVPPASFYFAIESFWHEEEWEEVYENYSEIFASLLATHAQQSFTEGDKADLIRQKGNIEKWIELLPEEEKQDLKKSGKAFIRFHFQQQRKLLHQMEMGELIDFKKIVAEQIYIVKNELPDLENQFIRQYMLEVLEQEVPAELIENINPFLNNLIKGSHNSNKKEIIEFSFSATKTRENNTNAYLDSMFMN